MHNGLYYIISRENAGCIVYDIVYIKVNEPEVFVPTVFTPNGDNENDRFQVIDKHIQELLVLKVFNQWGNLLFETNEMNDGWDGTYEGIEQEMDTYIFYLEAILYTGKQVNISGAFLLMR